jgi:hypothetical protein
MHRSMLVALAVAGCGGGALDLGTPCPSASLSINALEWADAYIDGAAAQGVSVTNACAGSDDLQLSVTVDGDASFGLAEERLTIRPGETQTVSVVYSPLDYGPHLGSVLMTTNDAEHPSLAVDLTGWAHPDQDGDGHDGRDAGGDDCNDFDAEVYPGAPESRDQQDQDCDGVADEDFVDPGDLAITEVMIDPAAVADGKGQWFEITNTSAVAINLVGYSVVGGGQAFGIATDLVVAAGERVVLGTHADPAENGGVEVDYAYLYADFALLPDGDLILTMLGQAIAELDWSGGGLAQAAGRSTGIDGTVSLALVDDLTLWCSASSSMTGGDQGTPGLPNDFCPSVDHDGDGYSEDAGDCDDADPDISPLGTETWDGIDNDCNGLTDDLSVAAVASGWVQGTGSERLGWPGLFGAGDIDADGVNEVVIGSQYSSAYYGAAYVLDAEDHDTFAGSITLYTSARVQSNGAGNPFWSVGEEFADNSGNGFVNLVVGGADLASSAATDNAVAIYEDWQISGDLASRDAYYGLQGTGASYGAGIVASNLDMNGDGVAEIVYGDPYYSEGTTYYIGRVSIVDSEPFTPGDYALADADGIYDGGSGYSLTGGALGGGDLDGDGYDDVVVRALGYGGVGSAAYYVLSGGSDLPASGGISTAATLEIGDVAAGTYIGAGGRPQVGDYADDGAADLVVSDHGADAVYLFADAGELSGTLDPGDASVTLSSSASSTSTQYGTPISTTVGPGVPRWDPTTQT